VPRYRSKHSCFVPVETVTADEAIAPSAPAAIVASARFVSFLAADLGQRELLSLRQFGGASVPSGSRIPDGGQQFCSAPS
jgi:hypothetical protein